MEALFAWMRKGKRRIRINPGRTTAAALDNGMINYS
jgi:hypothetical protein